MSHPGIMTRAEVVAAWLRDNQVPPDVRAALEEWQRDHVARAEAKRILAALAESKKSAPSPGVSSPSGITPPPDDGAPLAGVGADISLPHEHEATRADGVAGSGLMTETCRCGATRVADYRGMVGELGIPKRGAWT
jgi:hypothetical protein